ncbi:MAG: sigma-54-dependent Fis family transcriptional regulator [Deltaproteobacteria bacterium]|nr:sigma-54-dependent Fis family transcriptional regulator [Deltaproteobacteria bacterium]
MADGFKILITDDDSALRELLAEAAGGWGYSASIAQDGEEAIRRLRMEKYDIVITDLMMPRMDGITLLMKIKELDPSILVIIITGYSTIETAVKAIEAGAYDYIAKPFRLDELMIVLKKASERLRLVAQNKALLDELRSAYGEMAALKDALSRAGGAPPAAQETDGYEEKMGMPENGARNPLKRQEYLKEADRFLKVKTASKA